MHEADWAFVIDVANSKHMSTAIESAPGYDSKVSLALKRTIKMIHGLKDLHPDTPLQRLEVYLGRTSCSEQYLRNRWNDHWTNHKHRFAAVLFTCNATKVNQLETLAIRVLRRLKKEGSLCVGNVNVKEGDQGRPSATETAVIYMTWRIMPEAVNYEKPNIYIIRAVAQAVYEECGGWVKKAQLLSGLSTLKQLNSKVRLAQAPL